MTRAYVTVQRAQVSVSLGVLPSNAIRATLVDAKGDIIVASGADDVDRLAVGADGQVLTADSASALGIKWADPSGAVDSVNGKTGTVVLSAADVGAEASGTVATHAAVTSGVHGISAFGATLVDDASASAARTTLGLGNSATRNVGTASGEVAAGNDSRITGALQKSAYTAKGELLVATAADTPATFSLATNELLIGSSITGNGVDSVTWLEAANASTVFSLGDTLYADVSGLTVLPAGKDGEVLTMASGVPTWSAPTGGSDWSFVTAAGDLVVGSGSGAVDNLAVGTTGQILTADSGEALKMKWATGYAGYTAGTATGPNGATDARTTGATTYDRVAYFVHVLRPMLYVTSARVVIPPTSTCTLYIDGVSYGNQSNAGAGHAEATWTVNAFLPSGTHWVECVRTSGTSAWRDAGDLGDVGSGTVYGSGDFLLPNETQYGSSYATFGYTPAFRMSYTPYTWSASTGVPATRTLTTTAPLTIDGGASADLSGNRTLAVSAATTGATGVVQYGTDGETTALRAVQCSDTRLTRVSSTLLCWHAATAQTWSNVTAALQVLFANADRAVVQCDTTYASQVRFKFAIGAGTVPAGWRVGVQWSSDNVTWNNTDVASGGSANINSGTYLTFSATGAQTTAWQTLTANARGDRYWRVVADNGDGTSDPGVTVATMEVR